MFLCLSYFSILMMMVIPLVPGDYHWLWDSYSPQCLTDCHAWHSVLILAAVVCCTACVYWWWRLMSLGARRCRGLMICFCFRWTGGNGSHAKMPWWLLLFIWSREMGTGWGVGVTVGSGIIACIILHYLLDQYKRNEYGNIWTPFFLFQYFVI